MGSNMVYIQKWPWMPPEGESEYPWWRYLNRPVPEFEETEEIIDVEQIRLKMLLFFLVFRELHKSGATKWKM